MTSIELDMIQTAGIGALALIVGMVLTRKVAFLQKFCIPSPVSGGIIFSLLTLAGGANLYTAKSGTYASFRLAPTVYLPHEWLIGMQVVYYTRNSPRRETTGVPVYGCLSVNKQFGKKWYMGIDWHDMFDAFCSHSKVNRHAANIRLQYRF